MTTSAAAPSRGMLRLYLGAAPGVGKTYAMLAEGQRRRARGADVVAALVETHGRKLTALMAEGLETVPLAAMSYRGATFTEMDTDAVLARNPQVALVDELAHTNVPGCRNAKRWQDIEELLKAGIDVLTTLNIQHLESLNDVTRQITDPPALLEEIREMFGLAGISLLECQRNGSTRPTPPSPSWPMSPPSSRRTSDTLRCTRDSDGGHTVVITLPAAATARLQRQRSRPSA